MTALNADKQAIVVVHGVGEQRPMDTIKSFVETVWCGDLVRTANGMPDPRKVWSKPDERTGSLELRRITTRESIPKYRLMEGKGTRTDFYKLYWADLTANDTWSDILDWIGGLMLRNPLKMSQNQSFLRGWPYGS